MVRICTAYMLTTAWLHVEAGRKHSVPNQLPHVVEQGTEGTLGSWGNWRTNAQTN